MTKLLLLLSFFGVVFGSAQHAQAQVQEGAKPSCQALEACYSLGAEAFAKGNYSAAVPPFSTGCEMGHGQSCHYAGEAAKNAGDRPASRRFYGLACERSWPAGCLAHTRSLLDHRYGPVDYDSAIKQLAESCDESGVNQAAACQTLASAYSVGEYGLPIDDNQARALATKSCDLGDGFGCMLKAQYED